MTAHEDLVTARKSGNTPLNPLLSVMPPVLPTQPLGQGRSALPRMAREQPGVETPLLGSEPVRRILHSPRDPASSSPVGQVGTGWECAAEPSGWGAYSERCGGKEVPGKHVRDRPGGQRSGLRGRPGPARRPWGSGFRLRAKLCSSRLPAGPEALRLPLPFPAGLCQVGLSWLLPGEPVVGAPFGPWGPGGPGG